MRQKRISQIEVSIEFVLVLELIITVVFSLAKSLYLTYSVGVKVSWIPYQVSLIFTPSHQPNTEPAGGVGWSRDTTLMCFRVSL